MGVIIRLYITFPYTQLGYNNKNIKLPSIGNQIYQQEQRQLTKINSISDMSKYIGDVLVFNIFLQNGPVHYTF